MGRLQGSGVRVKSILPRVAIADHPVDARCEHCGRRINQMRSGVNGQLPRFCAAPRWCAQSFASKRRYRSAHTSVSRPLDCAYEQAAQANGEWIRVKVAPAVGARAQANPRNGFDARRDGFFLLIRKRVA